MLTKKYAVKVDTFEFDCQKYESPFDSPDWLEDSTPETIGLYDCLEEAESALKSENVLKKLYSEKFSSKLARCTVAYIEKADYDLNDDGEWEFVQGSDFYDCLWNENYVVKY